MPKLTYLSLCLILLWQDLPGQRWQQHVDSLERLLDQEKTDTGKINRYIELHFALISNKPEKALEYSIAAEELAESIKDTNLIVSALLRQCDFFNQIGDYTSTFEIAYKALELAGSNTDLLRICHNRIASAHSGLGNAQETLFHNRKALHYSSINGDSTVIARDLHNIGGVFIELEKFDSALYYLRFTNNYSKRITGKADPYSLSNIGRVYNEIGKHDSALIYHLEAYMYDSLDFQEYLLGIDEQYLAYTYKNLKQYTLAKKYARKSLSRSYKLDATDLALENYKYLYEIYAEEGNYRKAFEDALMYSKTADSVSEQQGQSIILGLETKYKFQEQAQRLNLLENQRTLFIKLTIVSVLFVISMIIIVLLAYRRHRATKELMKELEMANESKERLLSIISHDLRGSVGTMRTAARAISEGMTDIEDARALLENFYPVADSTYDLLENLLTWAKLNQQKIIPEFAGINLYEITQKSIEHTNHTALSKHVSIDNMIDPDLEVEADRNMILSVVRNLITNAIKFSHPKTIVTITSEVKGSEAIISVADEGVGIEPEVLAKLFHSPEDIQSSGTMGERGSGLGISICRTFLESHNGRLWAESTVGRGSTFNFSLPLVNALKKS
jgi:signal transduction histidine kinase